MKRQYTDVADRLDAYERFVNNLEEHTGDFDDLCDCRLEEGPGKGTHASNCMTMNFRKDVARLRE